MVGVNQVIMLSLNMVIIASMIGAGGLGFDVLAALRRLDIGAGLEAGDRHRGAGGRARPAEPGLAAKARQAPDRPSRRACRQASLCDRGARAGRRDGGCWASSLQPCSPIRRRGALDRQPLFGRWSAGSTSTSSTRSKRSRTRCCSTCWSLSSGCSPACHGSGVVGLLALAGWRLGGLAARARRRHRSPF